jgi:hypothetical protein
VKEKGTRKICKVGHIFVFPFGFSIAAFSLSVATKKKRRRRSGMTSEGSIKSNKGCDGDDRTMMAIKKGTTRTA